MKVAVIGGGAAGFFAAIAVKENYTNADVVILEKSNKLLAKVKISGGGRCNVTTGCLTRKELIAGYPRGAKKLKKLFQLFNNRDTISWFENNGVPLYTQEDNRVFPKSDSSQSIIDCLINTAIRLGVQIKMRENVISIIPDKEHFKLHFKQENKIELFDKVIVASGGSSKKMGFDWLEKLGHVIIEPVPSLFTFNIPDEPIRKLQGVVINNVSVSIQSTKLKSYGPLLITHWGMSGPAVLKLSAFGARILNDFDYNFKVQVNWVNVQNQDEILKKLLYVQLTNPKKKLENVRSFNLPQRFWEYLLERCALEFDRRWEDIGKKSFNKLVTHLTNDVYKVKGKTTFKEEFVTSGGVSLESIDINTMQSKCCPGLYFAGEVIDIDGITGGYNFQAAWTTAWIAGKLG